MSPSQSSVSTVTQWPGEVSGAAACSSEPSTMSTPLEHPVAPSAPQTPVFPNDPHCYSYGRLIGEGGSSKIIKIILKSNQELRLVAKVNKKEVSHKYAINEENILQQLNAVDKKGYVIKWCTGFEVDRRKCSIYERFDYDLRAYLKKGPPSLPDLFYITNQLSQAISFVHQQGFVHGDLKPENVGIKGRRFYLIDFGESFNLKTPHSPTSQFGTPRYLAPELICSSILNDHPTEQHQAFRNKQMTPALDVWALGCTLTEAYRGEYLITDNEVIAAPHTHLQERAQSQAMRILMVIAKNVEPIPEELFDQGCFSSDKFALREACVRPKTPSKFLKLAKLCRKEQCHNSSLSELDYRIRDFICATLRVDPEKRLKNLLEHQVFHLKVEPQSAAVEPKPQASIESQSAAAAAAVEPKPQASASP